MRKSKLVAILGAVVAGMMGTAHADTITGSVSSVIGANAGPGVFSVFVPTSTTTVFDNNVNVDNTLFAFNENQGVKLASALAVDGGTIAAGTVVDSEIVFFDPSDAQSLVGKVTFSGAILGVITTTAGLTNSDLSTFGLTLPGVTYSVVTESGLEGGDSAEVDGSNPKQLDWSTTASTPGDWVRVLTVSTPLPSGAWGGIALLGGLGLTAAGRRRFSRSM